LFATSNAAKDEELSRWAAGWTVEYTPQSSSSQEITNE